MKWLFVPIVVFLVIISGAFSYRGVYHAHDNMVFVEGGVFMMGSPDNDPLADNDEKPMHQVSVNSFYLDKYEVTNRQFCDFLNAMGGNRLIEEDSIRAFWIDIDDPDCNITVENNIFVAKKYAPDKDNPSEFIDFSEHPVLEVSWFGARDYAIWANKRLPTEAEWEYAARGGKKTKNYLYSGSNTAALVGWFDYNANNTTHPCGRKQANELGLYDMSGNVWEWCADLYDSRYYAESEIKDNPQGAETGKYRVLRGGSWASVAKELRVTARDFGFRNDAFYQNGFRCAKSVEKNK